MDPYFFHIFMPSCIVDRFYEEKTDSAPVGHIAQLLSGCYKPKSAVLRHLLAQLLKFFVHKYQHDVIVILILIFFCDFKIRRSLRIRSFLTVYFNLITLRLHLPAPPY